MIRQLLSALFVIAVLTAPVMAGGSGGTKKDAGINFNNDSALPVGVIVNPTQAQLTEIGGAGTPELALVALTKAGGKLLQPRASHRFSVKAGTQQIYYASVVPNAALMARGPFARSVRKGRTLTVLATSL